MHSPQEGSAAIQLQLPPGETLYMEQQVVHLEAADIAVLLVHVRRPLADDVPYSQIYVHLNGAAAARIAEFRPGEHGKLVRLNLRARPGFDLLPGANTVQVEALDLKGKRTQAAFTLHVPKGVCSGGGRARILSLSKLTDALRNGVASDRLVQYVIDCGVDFPLTNDIEARLRDLGAAEKLIAAIRNPLAPEFAEYQSEGLRLQEIVEMLRAGVAQEKIIHEVEERGVSFAFTLEAEQQLKFAGGGAQLLEAVRYMAGADDSKPPARGLTIQEIVGLLESGVDNNRVFNLVQEKGVNFRLDAAAEGELRAAGANAKLLRAIRLAAPN
jgi:hypothetical protein